VIRGLILGLLLMVGTAFGGQDECKPEIIFLVPDQAPPVLKLDIPDKPTVEDLLKIIAIQQAYIRQYQEFLIGF